MFNWTGNGNIPGHISNVGRKMVNGVMQHHIYDEELGLMGLGKVPNMQGHMPEGRDNTLLKLPIIHIRGISKGRKYRKSPTG